MAFDRRDYGFNKGTGIPFVKIADRVEVTVELQRQTRQRATARFYRNNSGIVALSRRTMRSRRCPSFDKTANFTKFKMYKWITLAKLMAGLSAAAKSRQESRYLNRSEPSLTFRFSIPTRSSQPP